MSQCLNSKSKEPHVTGHYNSWGLEFGVAFGFDLADVERGIGLWR